MYPGQKAKDYADRPAFIMALSGEVVTFGDYEARANRLAHLFRETGLTRGDHVAFLMENNPRLLECEGAAERTGLYYTLVNSHSSADEAAYIINNCQAELVVTSAAKKDVAEQLPALCPKVRRWLIVDTDAADQGFERYESAVAGFRSTPVDDEQLGQAMLYSSGTTGRPKGIYRPLADLHPADPRANNVPFLKRIWDFHEDMVYLSPSPLYHSAPHSSVSGAVSLGATSIIMERFDAALFLDLVARYRATHSQLVPTMFSRLLKLPEEVRTRADLSSLQRIIHAAAPCPIPVKYQMIDWFGPIITEYCSTTEGMGFCLCTTEEWLAHPGTVGKPIRGEPVILDDEGKPCPSGTPGNIWFHGVNFEYFGDPAKTAEARNATGELATGGDVGYLDDDGYLFLTDRKNFMIISGGVNIYPQEVENLLITHPKVLDAAVIGVPNEDFGEEVKAVIEVMPGVAAGAELEEELIAFCRENLAHFKCPRNVDFVPELPRSATGKLYKRQLRDSYWASPQTRVGDHD